MLFRPAVIALLFASGAGAATLAAAAPFVAEIVRFWDIRSGSERQLGLERRTYLISTLLTLVLVTQLLSLLLFVFNADRMAPLFVGAMCAVGALNVNGLGFPALIAQVLVFFLAAVWLVINRLDTQAPDYPLVRAKYKFLLGLTPLLILQFILQLNYFLGLNGNVITSCCGSLFSGEGSGISNDVAALPPDMAMPAFYGALLLAMASSLFAVVKARGGYAVAFTGMAAFIAGIAGIVSFLSLYIYEHPHHHCPFCLLKSEYGYSGYWLYGPLFLGTAAAMGAGAAQFFSDVASLRRIAPRMLRRLAAVAAASFTLFAVISAVMVMRSNLRLIGG
jgi:hypothetical protein